MGKDTGKRSILHIEYKDPRTGEKLKTQVGILEPEPIINVNEPGGTEYDKARGRVLGLIVRAQGNIISTSTETVDR